MSLFFKRVKAVLRGLYRPLKYRRDYYYLRHQVKNINSCNGTFDKSNALILIPHADDEWVGCSQFISNHNGTVVLCNMDMNGGDTPELHKQRFSELKTIANRCKVQIVTIKRENEKVSELAQLIEEKKPKYILVPFYYDWHLEHIEVMDILRKALMSIALEIPEYTNDAEVVMYQVSVPIPIAKITHGIPMSRDKHIEKWNVFDEVYKTQASIPWIRFKYNERINGGIYNSYAAEVYACIKASVWIENFEKEILSANEGALVNENLQDLKKVRIAIEKIRS